MAHPERVGRTARIGLAVLVAGWLAGIRGLEIAHTQPPAANQPESSGRPIPLRGLIDMALANNRQIRSARLNVDVSALSLRATRASYFGATLDADGSQRRDSAFGTDESTALFNSRLTLSHKLFTGGTLAFSAAGNVIGSSVAGTDRGTQSMNFSFSQPLLRGAGRTIALAPMTTSQIDRTLANESLRQTMMDVVVQVERAYWDLLLQSEAVKLQAQALERSRRLRETTLALIDAGRVARNEVVQTEADIASQEVSMISAEQSLRRSENELRSVLDTALPGSIQPIPPDRDDLRPADLAASVQLAFLNRPDWRSAELAIEITELSVTAARSNRLYGVDLETSYGREGAAAGYGSAFSHLSDRSSASVALKVDVPLNNVENTTRYASAQIGLQQARIQLEEQRQQIELEIDDAVRAVNLQMRQLELTRRARELAQRALEVEVEKLRVGRSTGFNVVRLQTDVNVALNSELQARIGYLLARSALDRATGVTLQRWNITFP